MYAMHELEHTHTPVGTKLSLTHAHAAYVLITVSIGDYDDWRTIHGGLSKITNS